MKRARNTQSAALSADGLRRARCRFFDPPSLLPFDITSVEALVGFTCRYTAGLRRIESAAVPQLLPAAAARPGARSGAVGGVGGLQLAQRYASSRTSIEQLHYHGSPAARL